jgi:hypothetical protein|tara:strand:- start:1066 stop:1245 length:180 start_codon:yes stop_codon:yes gene_type:complete
MEEDKKYYQGLHLVEDEQPSAAIRFMDALFEISQHHKRLAEDYERAFVAFADLMGGNDE